MFIKGRPLHFLLTEMFYKRTLMNIFLFEKLDALSNGKNIFKTGTEQNRIIIIINVLSNFPLLNQGGIITIYYKKCT